MFWLGVAIGVVIGAFIGVLVLSVFIAGREEITDRNERG
jgi:integral membrane sensor domain MASE1